MHRLRKPNVVPIVALLVSLAALAGLAGVVIVATGPHAEAAVTRIAGFHGSVDGFEGWFGSYNMGGIGPAFCIDHGIPDPDPALGYVPFPPAELPAEVGAAMSWITARWSRPDDAVTSAAMVLALHDLMDARYPSGPLEVFELRPGDLRGFAGNEAQVIAYARLLELDGLAHRHLRAPFHLSAQAKPIPAGSSGVIVVKATDAAGAPVRGAVLAIKADGARLSGPVAARSDSSGSARFTFTAGSGRSQFEAVLITAAAEPAIFAPTRQRAQRVIRPAFATTSLTTSFDNAYQPSTTTTVPATTVPPTIATTTVPSTTVPPTISTTTVPATIPATTTTLTSISTSTTAPAVSTAASPTTIAVPTAPSPEGPAPNPAPRAAPQDSAVLAHTGSSADSLAAVGIGTSLLGLAAVLTKRRFSAAKPPP